MVINGENSPIVQVRMPVQFKCLLKELMSEALSFQVSHHEFLRVYYQSETCLDQPQIQGAGPKLDFLQQAYISYAQISPNGTFQNLNAIQTIRYTIFAFVDMCKSAVTHQQHLPNLSSLLLSKGLDICPLPPCPIVTVKS